MMYSRWLFLYVHIRIYQFVDVLVVWTEKKLLGHGIVTVVY